MAVTAKRTLANVKSSAIRPRQPEVPNLIGDAVIGEVAIVAYSILGTAVLKGKFRREKSGSARGKDNKG
jgi:hypothetical protein